jgi:hypothetical protein
MSTWPVEGKLLLSYLWAVPMADAESERLLARGTGTGTLEPLPGKLGEEWAHAEDFLIIGTGRPARYQLTGAPLAVGSGPEILPANAIVTWHAGYHTMTVVVAVTVTGRRDQVLAADTDLAIAVLQSLEDRPAALPGEGAQVHGLLRGKRHRSVHHAVTAALGQLVDGTRFPELQRRSWCVELRGYHGYPAGRTVSGDPRPFYGLATGDEGWRFVPAELAAERLGEPWGTRVFVAVYPTASGTVCLNAKGADYVGHQREFTQRYFGREEPYFALDSEVAGLDHGTLFALERVVVRLALADRWLRQVERRPEDLGGPGKAAARTRLLRGSLDDIQQLLNSLLPPEVDSLERRLVTSMGVDRIIRQLDRQAEAMDEETRYSYESEVSGRVTRLTVVTVVLTVVTIVLGVLQVIVSL